MSSTMTLTGQWLAPASGEAPREIVVLLHGYGSNGADMIGLAPLWRHSLPHAGFYAPNAPERCPGAPGGYQWWALTAFDRASLASGVQRAAPRLDDFLDAVLAEHGLGEDRLVLVGFSQGTMMALHVGPCRERRIAGIVGYSGMLADVAGLPHRVRTKPPVLLLHGMQDEVVPFTAMAEAEHALHRLGFDVRSHALKGLGHSVDETGIALGAAFARKTLG